MAAKRKTTKSRSKRTKASSPKLKPVESMSVATDSMSNASFDSTKVKTLPLKTKASLLIAFIVIVFALYKGKGYFVAAVVNNQPITRFSVISELEKRSGKQALDTIVTQTLIKQEAKKKDVSISSDELDAEVAKIEASVKSQNQDLDSLLSLQGMTRDDLKDQIETQKLVEKIFGSEIDPTDKEIEDYMTQNKDTLTKGATTEDQKAQVKDILRQQKLSDKFQTWITELKAGANIKYYVSY